MPVTDFTDSVFSALLAGMWKPVQLVLVEWQEREKDPKKLEKLSFDPKDQYFFRFCYHKPGDELDGATSVVWANDVSSKEGNLYKLALGLAGGAITKPWDQLQKELLYKWFSIQVVETKKDSFRVSMVMPIDAPDGQPTDRPTDSYKSNGSDSDAGGEEDPFEA